MQVAATVATLTGMDETQPPTSTLPRLLSIHDVADILGVSVSRIYQWRTQGRDDLLPPAFPVGRQLRWHPDDVNAWLRLRRGAAKPIA